jgi:nucleoside-triphosphatase
MHVCLPRSDLLDRDVVVLATVHVHRHPFTNALKRRADLRVIRVTERSRDALPERLAAELTAAAAARRPSDEVRNERS